MNTSTTAGLRLLVVDDNAAIHEDIRKVFSPRKAPKALDDLEAEVFGSVAADEGWAPHLDFALQGEVALGLVERAVAEKNPYAVAFVDMRMPPGWDGLTTIERLWKVDPLLQVVICTAYSDHSWAEITSRLGQRDNLLILKKPFDGIELHQMGTALGRKWLLQRQALADRHALETRMLLADRMASVGTLAGGVAHEINNPLAFVTSNLDFIGRALREMSVREPSEALVELADVVSESQRGVERIRRIVRDLKTFSRGDDQEQGPVDVNRCLELSINMAMNEIRHRAKLVTQFLPVPNVEANESRLGQVFLNLLVNAAQAIESGHASENQICVTTGTDAQGRVTIEVSDTGCGIPENVRARIFEPFFTTKPIGEGTGLGLSICHGIIKSFGGTIVVESTPGRGSTFKLVLPACAVAATASPAEPAPSAPSIRQRILVVDDEAFLAQSIRRTLREHDVQIVGSGREALTALSADSSFDVILCDLMMPEMTGIQLHEEMRLTTPGLLGRMVFMTGGVFSADGREFLDRVSNQVLDKPIDMDKLRALMSGMRRPEVDHALTH